MKTRMKNYVADRLAVRKTLNSPKKDVQMKTNEKIQLQLNKCKKCLVKIKRLQPPDAFLQASNESNGALQRVSNTIKTQKVVKINRIKPVPTTKGKTIKLNQAKLIPQSSPQTSKKRLVVKLQRIKLPLPPTIRNCLLEDHRRAKGRIQIAVTLTAAATKDLNESDKSPSKYHQTRRVQQGKQLVNDSGMNLIKLSSSKGNKEKQAQLESLTDPTTEKLSLESKEANNNKNSATSRNGKQKNFAGHEAAIEELLCCDTEDNLETVLTHYVNSDAQNINNECKKKEKFFHRNEKAKPTKIKKSLDNVYAFPSSSDSNESIKLVDPTADIIKKMIEENKVTVATKCKGKGKLIVKRQRNTQKQKQEAKVGTQKNKFTSNNKQIVKTTHTKHMIVSDNEDLHDFAQADEQFIDDEEVLFQNVASNAMLSNIPKKLVTQNAAFVNKRSDTSTLARDILVKEANKRAVAAAMEHEQMSSSKFASTYVSTPANKKKLPIDSLNMSPITLSTPHQKSVRSAQLPKALNSSRDPLNLLSFSSDYISTSQTQVNDNLSESSAVNNNLADAYPSNVKLVQHVVELPPWKPSGNSLQSQIHTNLVPDEMPSTSKFARDNLIKKARIIEAAAVERQRKQFYLESKQNTVSKLDDEETSYSNVSLCKTNKSQISYSTHARSASFSSNDSNMENMPPSNNQQQKHLQDSIFNLRQQPNPRRTLQNRSPLKDINVQEIICLQQTNMQDHSSSNFPTNMSDEKPNLFGFEEFIVEESNSKRGNETDNANTNLQNETNLNNKLKTLEKKWRPNYQQKPTLQAPIKSRLFDDDDERSKQRSIKEMLTSTMIQQNKNQCCKLGVADVSIFNNESELIKDSEVSFGEKNPVHRTYMRPQRKKKKTKCNNFIFFSDNDTSDDEEVPTAQNKQKHKAKENEHTDNNPELDSFVTEFNSMCKEVEQYELIIE